MRCDYLIVGAGLFGAVFGRQMRRAGRSVLIIDKRKHIGGNVYTDDCEGICRHVYGPHLFHTNDERIWKYVQRFAKFNNYQHRVKANYCGQIFSLPFNMQTFNDLWGVTTPAEARAEIERQRVKIDKPANLEEWALSQVGPDVYHTLIEGYTTKQWGRSPKFLPASIIKRLPLRFTYNDNYFNDKYQGVPIKGYTHLVENILDGIEVRTETEFVDVNWRKLARHLVYTGPIDEFFDNCFGPLEYRSLRFEHEVVDGDFQGIGQMNYTSKDVPYTRIVEHKHFRFQKSDKSIITREYPQEWEPGRERYYPINDEKNMDLYEKYRLKSKELSDVTFGGRLGVYRYYDMHQVVASALTAAQKMANVPHK